MSGGPRRDVIGHKYNRLTILADAPRDAGAYRKVLCRCECGNEKVFFLHNILRDVSKSCGCLVKETSAAMSRTHGLCDTPEYGVWRGMLDRCHSKTSQSFANYGGRGITVCKGWREDFVAFRADVGNRPSMRHSIDRIDNNRGYNCGRCADCIARGEGPNCRWATQRVQARNTRRNVWIVVGGERMLATDWAARIGISRQALEQRIASGMPPEKAVTMPRAGRKAA